MALVHTTTHVEEAPSFFLEQYQQKPLLKAWLLSYVRRCQELDDAAFDVAMKRIIDNAEGAQLDALGRLVGETRKGKADVLYRVYLYARIRINWSRGKPDDIIAVLRIVEAALFRLRWAGPDLIDVEYREAPATSGFVLFDLANLARMAGVRINVIVPTSSERGFRFGSRSSPTLNEDRGFGSPSDDSVGGLLEMEFTNG
jgi:hypothetical protein